MKKEITKKGELEEANLSLMIGLDYHYSTERGSPLLFCRGEGMSYYRFHIDGREREREREREEKKAREREREREREGIYRRQYRVDLNFIIHIFKPEFLQDLMIRGKGAGFGSRFIFKWICRKTIILFRNLTNSFFFSFFPFLLFFFSHFYFYRVLSSIIFAFIYYSYNSFLITE